jgi:hypothetical protein
MQHTRCPPPRVIIFLDEILKARNPDESLHLVCEFMEIFSGSDLCKSVDVLSTTLDPEVIINLGTKSNRRASVAPLPAFRNIRKLFPDSDVAYHLAIRAGGVSLNLVYPNTVYSYRLISMLARCIIYGGYLIPIPFIEN